MNARNGNWTIPQLLLDLEARVAELEAINHTVYVHHVSFTATNVNVVFLDIVNATGTLFTSDSLLEYLMALPENNKITCTGNNLLDVAVMSLRKEDNVIKAEFVDTDSANFTTLTLLNDYVEAITI